MYPIKHIICEKMNFIMNENNVIIPFHVISTVKIVYLTKSCLIFLVLLFTYMSNILNMIKNNAFYILIYSLLLVITISFVDLYYKFDKLIDKLIEQKKEKKEREKEDNGDNGDKEKKEELILDEPAIEIDESTITYKVIHQTFPQLSRPEDLCAVKDDGSD